MEEKAKTAAKLKANLPRNPGTKRMCITKAYTMMLISAQVSFGF